MLAERAAWDFVAVEGRGMELTTVLPTAVFGPVRSAPEFHDSLMVVSSSAEGALTSDRTHLAAGLEFT